VYLLGFSAVAAWLLWRRLTRLALFVAVTVAVNPLLNELVKVLVHRARPVLTDPVVHADGASFPSGHAQAAMVGYSVLLLVFLQVLRGPARAAAVTVAALMALAIGSPVSRWACTTCPMCSPATSSGRPGSRR
jgi:membrane-associated phospholipid phosphatase